MEGQPTKDIQAKSSFQGKMSPVRQLILNIFNQKSDPRLVYHNYHFTEALTASTRNIAEQNSYSDKIVQTAELAAQFYTIGFLFDYENPLPKSLQVADKYMKLNEVEPIRQQAVIEALKTVFGQQTSKSKVTQVLNDALCSIYFGTEFLEQNQLLRLEKELILNQKYNKAEWAQFQLDNLLNARFYTPFGKVNYEPVLATNILAQKEQAEKYANNRYLPAQGEVPRKFQNIERKIPNSGNQTFFRTNYRNHINLSAIADNKANIMISVNAIVVSVIISILSYRNLAETQPEILMPAIIFIVSGLTSLIFAVLSARPKITSVNKDLASIEAAKKNVVFFGNFTSLKIEEYEEAIDTMLRDSELLYGNMTRDLYYLGKVLDKKYRYLTLSYNVFMVGFVATVVAFLGALLF